MVTADESDGAVPLRKDCSGLAEDRAVVSEGPLELLLGRIRIAEPEFDVGVGLGLEAIADTESEL